MQRVLLCFVATLQAAGSYKFYKEWFSVLGLVVMGPLSATADRQNIAQQALYPQLDYNIRESESDAHCYAFYTHNVDFTLGFTACRFGGPRTSGQSTRQAPGVGVCRSGRQLTVVRRLQAGLTGRNPVWTTLARTACTACRKFHGASHSGTKQEGTLQSLESERRVMLPQPCRIELVQEAGES
ncbi:hypothetical protein ElyMa_000493200 [Elysia marginata]|uniref:Uncharacterized protein n=1 Tax=Elysia marginata TaxID=1093978 RepID=A0AAV4FV04_9GAST|nr:hypothetical protein ElyMa_000493200 [Elysia marginata]